MSWPAWRIGLKNRAGKWCVHAWKVQLNQNVHAIGDRANKVVIDAIENAIINGNAATGTEASVREQGRRFRIEHAQIMRMEDLERAVKLGVIASYQPTHATSDVSTDQTQGTDEITDVVCSRKTCKLTMRPRCHAQIRADPRARNGYTVHMQPSLTSSRLNLPS